MELKAFEESTPEEILGVLAKFDQLPERVRQYVWEDAKDIYVELGYGLLRYSYCVACALEYLDKTESPIEQLMALAMHYYLPHWADGFHNIIPQHKVKTASGTYRVDFVVEYQSSEPHLESYPTHLIAVECDGHDYHEKTKVQAAKDKQRDRALHCAGYAVLRFTGSEIYKDPNACTREVADLINNTLLKHRK